MPARLGYLHDQFEALNSAYSKGASDMEANNAAAARVYDGLLSRDVSFDNEIEGDHTYAAARLDLESIWTALARTETETPRNSPFDNSILADRSRRLSKRLLVETSKLQVRCDEINKELAELENDPSRRETDRRLGYEVKSSERRQSSLDQSDTGAQPDDVTECRRPDIVPSWIGIRLQTTSAMFQPNSNVASRLKKEADRQTKFLEKKLKSKPDKTPVQRACGDLLTDIVTGHSMASYWTMRKQTSLL